MNKRLLIVTLLLVTLISMFGAYFDARTSAAGTNDAVITGDTIPTTMIIGQTYPVTITVKNTGEAIWTETGQYRLGAVGDSDIFAFPRQYMSGSDSIASNQTKTFSFNMQAPIAQGTYSTHWEMVQEGVEWFGASLSKTITVVKPNDAVITSDNIPTTMVAGQIYNVNITLTNNGSNTWSDSGNYRLGAVDDSDVFAFPRQNMSGSDSIAPGQQKTFSFTMQAPYTLGTNSTHWQMVQDGVEWFGAILAKTITIIKPNDATIVSDTIPTTMTAGQNYNVSITVMNSGGNTWSDSGNYRLGAVGDSDSLAFPRQNLSGSDLIAPGQQKTFSFTMKAPWTVGTYPTHWKMVQDGVEWFGATLAKTVTIIKPNDAIIVSDTIPTTMGAGQSYNVNVTVQNTGANTWLDTGNYHLGAMGDSDPLAAPRQFMSGSDSIAPGQQKTFSFTMQAPTVLGTYPTDWQMVQDGVEWFGAYITKSVTVLKANDATITSDTIPSTMVAGQTYNVNITVKNTGGNTWFDTGNFHLGAVGDSDPFTGGRQFLNSSETIAPGQSKTFSITMTAPTTPGSYTTDWRMVQDLVEWFGATLTKNVIVSAPSVAFPTGWSAQDIGTVGTAGSTSFDGTTFTVSGSGNYTGAADTGHYFYTQLAGVNDTMTVRITNFNATNSNAKAGLMIRNTLSPDSVEIATMLMTASVRFWHRDTTAGTLGSSSGTGTTPLYLKLTRTGTAINGSYSTNGTTWTSITSKTITLGDPVYVGLAVCSGTTSVATAQFDTLTVNGTSLGSVPTPTPTPTPTATPTPTPTPTPTVTSTATPDPNATPTPTPAQVPLTDYNLTGFANVTTGGGLLAETDPGYAKVTTPQQFLDALYSNYKNNGVKVIEIMNDLNLGYTEVGTAVSTSTSGASLLSAHATPKLHPVLLQTGVSKIDIKPSNGGLTIFSANGATIKHCTFNVKSTHNIIIRNLKFDEMWEWDEASKGNYDGNDWDFIDLGNGGPAYNVWIDHCTFTKAYDGIVDIKAGSYNITFSWNKYLGDDGATNPNSWVRQQFNYLEQNMAAYPMYNWLRTHGFSIDDLVTINQGHDKTHLLGSNDKDPQNATINCTFDHEWYVNVWDRLPVRLRAGNVHVYNFFADDTVGLAARRLRDARVAAMAPADQAKLDGSSPTYHMGVFLNGTICTEGGAVLVENSIYQDCLYPLRNNQTDITDPTYTGKIIATNSIYHMDNADSTVTEIQGNSEDPGNPMGPFQAPKIAFSWNGFTTLPYTYSLDDLTVLKSYLAAGSGAGILSWDKSNWLKVSY